MFLVYVLFDGALRAKALVDLKIVRGDRHLERAAFGADVRVRGAVVMKGAAEQTRNV
jgi:hypothetical protein